MRLKAEKYKRRNKKETIFVVSLFFSYWGEKKRRWTNEGGAQGMGLHKFLSWAMLTSPSPPHGSLSEVERWIAPFFRLTEVEQGSRQDRRPRIDGSGALVEAGVGVVGVVPVRC